MHIMEGFLPWQWCLLWWLIALPFLVMGVIELRALMRKDREYLPLLGVSGAFKTSALGFFLGRKKIAISFGKPIYPAAYPGVIGVAASNGDQLANYSNRGDFVDLVAPGSAASATSASSTTTNVASNGAMSPSTRISSGIALASAPEA